jgi:ABC-type multidrug transport system fused ATPase/permease subunit
MAGRTTFLVAHRLSTLENCDILLTIDRGVLVANEDRSRHALR